MDISSKMNAYKRNLNETKYMSFFIKDIELLQKCTEIWEKVSNNIKDELDSESVYNEKYIKTKTKPYK